MLYLDPGILNFDNLDPENYSDLSDKYNLK